MENPDYAGIQVLFHAYSSFPLDLKSMDIFELDSYKARTRTILVKTREKKKNNLKQNKLMGLQLKEVEKAVRKELRRIHSFQVYLFGFQLPHIIKSLRTAGRQFLTNHLFTFSLFCSDLANMDIFGLEVYKAETRDLVSKTREKRASNSKENSLTDLWLSNVDEAATNELRRISDFEIYTFDFLP